MAGQREKLDEISRIQRIVESGYAGILQNGNIVDRREYPKATPVQKNAMLGVPEPRSLDGGGADESELPERQTRCAKCGNRSEYAKKQKDRLCLRCFIDLNTRQ